MVEAVMTTVLPSVAVLELTYCCNHACRFCSCPWLSGMMKVEPEMTIGEWMRLIDELSSAGVRQFSFTGGEALLKEGCMELLDFDRALLRLFHLHRRPDFARYCLLSDPRHYDPPRRLRVGAPCAGISDPDPGLFPVRRPVGLLRHPLFQIRVVSF